MDGAAQEFDVEAPPPAATPGPRAASREARLAVGFTLLAVALIAAGIVLTPDQDPTARGIVANLDAAPELVWEVPLNSNRASSGQVWIGSNVVLAASANSVHAVHLASGQKVWEVRAPRLRCARDGQDIACASQQGTRSELIEITMADGEVARTVQTGLVAAHPHDGGAITPFEESGTLTVMRWGPAGEHRWSHAVSGAEVELEGLALTVADDLVLIQAPQTQTGSMFALVLDVADGHPRDHARAFMTDDGQWVVDRGGSITVHDRLGRAAPADGHGAILRVDDDLRSDQVPGAERGDFLAVSRSDGSAIWRFDAGPAGVAVPHARLADTFVGWKEGTWYGFDVADGSLLWTRKGSAPQCPCLGSGTVLAGVAGDDAPVLTGIDVTTGAERWQVPLSDFRGFSYDVSQTHLAVFTVTGLSVWTFG